MSVDTLPTTNEQARGGGMRELLQVAWPLVISQGSNSLQYVVDRAFLSRYSQEALAASLPAAMLHFSSLSLAFGILSYLTAFVAQYEGAGQRAQIGRVVWQGVWLALAFGVLLMIPAFYARQIIENFDHDPMMANLEIKYFRILCFGSAPLLLSTALACFFSGRGETSLIMWVNMTGTLVNVVFNAVLIPGRSVPGTDWAIPAMGISGSAIATVISFSVVAMLYVVALARHRQRQEYRLWPMAPPDRVLGTRILRFGFANGTLVLVDVLCWTMFVELIGRLGPQQTAATTLAFNLNTLVFIPLLGLGTAVMTLVGRHIGEGNPDAAARVTWRAAGLALGWTASFGLVYVLAPHWILSPYRDPNNAAKFAELEPLVVQLLRFVAVYSLFDSLSIVFSSATRGAGDTFFAVCFSLTAGLVVLVIPTYLSTGPGGGGLSSAWLSATVYVSLSGGVFFVRFVQGRWRTMKIIERTVI